MRVLPLVVALSGAFPERALFLFEFHGVPVGTVELRWEAVGPRYTYRSTHWVTRGDHRTRLSHVDVQTVDGEGKVPEVWPLALWLWKAPGPGCVEGQEEITHRHGLLCAEAPLSPTERQGTLLGQPFHATYSDGLLSSLELPDARFSAVPPGTRAAWPPDLFASGVPVVGEEPGHPKGPSGGLAFDPPLLLEEPPLRPSWKPLEARRLAQRVYNAFPDKHPGAADFTGGFDEGGSCLAHARRFVQLARAQGRDAAVVHGLLVEPAAARGYPHVWVRVRQQNGQTLELDPTSLDAVRPSTHLPLAVEGVGESPGAVWLRLFSGRLRAVRR